MRRCLPLLLLVAYKSSTPSSPTNTTTKPAGPGTWAYAAKLDAEGNGKGTPRRVTLTEIGRKKIGGASVVELRVDVDGKPVNDGNVHEFGNAPFVTMSPELIVIAKGSSVWLAFGDQMPDEARVAEVTKEKATWTVGVHRDGEPAEPPMDEDYAFAKKIKTWDSACTGYIHPAPDSGDTFSSEKCFAPNVGITHLQFDSVWGGYDLTLESGPASFSVD